MSKQFQTGKFNVATPLAQVQVRLLDGRQDKARAHRLLAKHHYLGDVQAVGEQLFYALTSGGGDWLGVLVFCAASRRLRGRDGWIGWTEEQRRRRLPLVVNNCRFLLLPEKTFPNLGSRSLRLALDRLSADWQERYGHPVVLACWRRLLLLECFQRIARGDFSGGRTSAPRCNAYAHLCVRQSDFD
jgi:hypothetical protein